MKISNNLIFFMSVFLYNGIMPSQSRDTRSHVWNIVSLQDALINVQKVIDNFPLDDSVAAQVYEAKQSSILVKCAKVLYDNARQQILAALQEIDNRRAYWQYQKDHQWQYFLTKNPLKWVTGQSQEEEVQNNLELLESQQGELYVRLGQLSEHNNLFVQGYKTIFLTDYKKGYEWIDGLSNLLLRIKISVQPIADNSAFIARALLLKLQLEGVSYFKEDLLSDIEETQVPTQFAQKWLKYGMLGLGLALGYRMDGLEKLKNSFNYITQEAQQQIVSPVQNVMRDVFFIGPNKSNVELLVPQDEIQVAKESIKVLLGSLDNKEIEGIVNEQTGDINTARLQALSDKLLHSWSPIKLKKGAEAAALWGKLLALQAASHTQEQLVDIQKQYAGVGKIAFLTPAIFSGLLAYGGYQKLTKKNYGPIRRALLEINSLFVDQSKPLDDESYGKMVYLLYNLKKRAKKELPEKKNLRAEFLQDLEKIESKEFDVAAKRRIVDDMFRKYSFLGLV